MYSCEVLGNGNGAPLKTFTFVQSRTVEKWSISQRQLRTEWLDNLENTISPRNQNAEEKFY